MKVQRCEQIIIKKDHPKFKIIDEMCFNSKNLRHTKIISLHSVNRQIVH